MSAEAGYGWWVRFGLLIAIALWVATALAMATAIIIDASGGAMLASSKDLIAPLVAATGVLIAVLAFLRDRGKMERERAEARSKIFLEQAKQSFEQAYELLRGLPQDRVKWVRAARLISEAEVLGKSIPSEDYRRVFILASAHYRHLLYEALMVPDESGGRVALPPAFFFGLADWQTSTLSLNDMGLDTIPKMRLRAGNSVRPQPEAAGLGIAAESVIVVYEFLRFPDLYADPLDDVDTDAWKKWSKSHGAAQGAYRYLEHRDQYVVIGGTMMEKSTGEPVRRTRSL